MPFHVIFLADADPSNIKRRCRINEIERSSVKLHKPYVRFDVGVTSNSDRVEPSDF